MAHSQRSFCAAIQARAKGAGELQRARAVQAGNGASAMAIAEDDAVAVLTPYRLRNTLLESGSEAGHVALGDTLELATAPEVGNAEPAPTAHAADGGCGDFL